MRQQRPSLRFVTALAARRWPGLPVGASGVRPRRTSWRVDLSQHSTAQVRWDLGREHLPRRTGRPGTEQDIELSRADVSGGVTFRPRQLPQTTFGGLASRRGARAALLGDRGQSQSIALLDRDGDGGPRGRCRVPGLMAACCRVRRVRARPAVQVVDCLPRRNAGQTTTARLVQMSDGGAILSPEVADMGRLAPTSCPRCSAEVIIPVVWGMPAPDDLDRAERGEFALGGCCVPDDYDTATYGACRDCGYQFAFVPLGNDSPIGRLLDEISWEGNARTYRGGGRGRENVLTTEVFTLLDLLPRSAFLGAVLSAAHGADTARAVAIAETERMVVSVLPGDVHATLADGSTSTWTVQPDVRLEAHRAVVWVEAKRIRPSSFQEHQIARTLQALLSSPTQASRLLLLVLDSPPPVKVRRVGTVEIAEAVAHSTSQVGSREREELLAATDDVVAWLTWAELAAAVRQSAGLYGTHDPSTGAAVHRMAAAVDRAIAWHG